MRRKIFPNLQRFVWRRHAGAHRDAMGLLQKPPETSVTKFCYKSVNLSLEELRNVTIIPFSTTRTVEISKFPEISHFFILRNKDYYYYL